GNSGRVAEPILVEHGVARDKHAGGREFRDGERHFRSVAPLRDRRRILLVKRVRPAVTRERTNGGTWFNSRAAPTSRGPTGPSTALRISAIETRHAAVEQDRGRRIALAA